MKIFIANIYYILQIKNFKIHQPGRFQERSNLKASRSLIGENWQHTVRGRVWARPQASNRSLDCSEPTSQGHIMELSPEKIGKYSK